MWSYYWLHHTDAQATSYTTPRPPTPQELVQAQLQRPDTLGNARDELDAYAAANGRRIRWEHYDDPDQVHQRLARHDGPVWGVWQV